MTREFERIDLVLLKFFLGLEGETGIFISHETCKGDFEEVCNVPEKNIIIIIK